MRRGAAWGLLAASLAAGLAAWVAGAALSAASWARAQSPDMPIELRRVQHADYVPPPNGKRPIFILVIGSDARPGVCMPVDGCLADSLHLIGVNPRKRAATILGFPRDSYVQIPGFGREKINNALFHGGPELVVRTVEELTGITINYYLLASFSQVVAMVDHIGGLEVNIPYDIGASSNLPSFAAGSHELDGEEVLALARNRKGTPNGDFSRSENQGRILVAALKKLQDSFGEDPVALFRWIAVGSRMETDLGLDEVFDLMVTALTIRPDSVSNLVLPGDVGYAGPASVVFLDDRADRIFDDMRRDGLA